MNGLIIPDSYKDCLSSSEVEKAVEKKYNQLVTKFTSHNTP